MNARPATVYVVSVFETWYWQSVLATKDMAEALALAQELGDRGRIEEKPQTQIRWAGLAAAVGTSFVSPANDWRVVAASARGYCPVQPPSVGIAAPLMS